MAIIVGTECVSGSDGVPEIRPLAFHTMHVMGATEGTRNGQMVPDLTTVHLNGDCAQGFARAATLAVPFIHFQQHVAAADPKAMLALLAGQRDPKPVIVNPHNISNLYANMIGQVGTMVGLTRKPSAFVAADYDDVHSQQRLWISANAARTRQVVEQARNHQHNDVVVDLSEPAPLSTTPMIDLMKPAPRTARRRAGAPAHP